MKEDIPNWMLFERHNSLTLSPEACEHMPVECPCVRRAVSCAVGLVRSEASAERLNNLGGTPVRGTVTDLDVLAKAAASCKPLWPWTY